MFFDLSQGDVCMEDDDAPQRMNEKVYTGSF